MTRVRMPIHRLLLGAAVATLGCPAIAQEPTRSIVRTWDGREIEATGLVISDESLTLLNGSSEQTLGWHRVHSISGPRSGEALPMIELGRDVWRASARLARGDSFGAEPLFELAFERTRGTIGPTPTAVADGLLRCRLRRDARAAAIDAWLELAANLAVAPARTPGWGVQTPALEPRTRLVPSLPPIWFDNPAARAFADAIITEPTGQDGDESATGYAQAIRLLYRAAARHAIGDPIDSTAVSRAASVASSREGGALVVSVVLAQIGGPEARAAARAELARELPAIDNRWRSVWASIAIGRSLLREPGAGEQRRGVLTLLAVHATDADVAPYLTGVALADAAFGADRLGDAAAGRAIRADLRRDYPDHPARRLPGIAAVPNLSPAPNDGRPGASI